jgi:hypothetical protein
MTVSEIAEKFIRSAARKGNILYSRHAVIRMAERGICKLQIQECIINGKVIEFQDHGMDLKVLFQEANNGYPEFYSKY